VTAPAAQVQQALVEVLDPEYPISIVDLGLVRGVSVDGTTAHVKITYTSLGCPCTELIQDDIRDRLLQVEGIEEVEIEEVFEPWTRRDISMRGLKLLQENGVG
jgi:metal-sulfur cluster biosynthetic enzyme